MHGMRNWDLHLSNPGHQRSQFTPLIETGLFVPFARTSTTQARAFSVVGPNEVKWPHRLNISRWLAPLCGMAFLWRNDCSPVFFLTHSSPASKLFFLAVQGPGELLSSNLEEALYKYP